MFRCKKFAVCKKSFNNNNLRYDHEKNCNVSFVCRLCKVKYESQSGFYKHRRNHHGGNRLCMFEIIDNPMPDSNVESGSIQPDVIQPVESMEQICPQAQGNQDFDVPSASTLIVSYNHEESAECGGGTPEITIPDLQRIISLLDELDAREKKLVCDRQKFQEEVENAKAEILVEREAIIDEKLQLEKAQENFLKHSATVTNNLKEQAEINELATMRFVEKVRDEDWNVKFIKDRKTIGNEDMVYVVWEGTWTPVDEVRLYASRALAAFEKRQQRK